MPDFPSPTESYWQDGRYKRYCGDTVFMTDRIMVEGKDPYELFNNILNQPALRDLVDCNIRMTLTVVGYRDMNREDFEERERVRQASAEAAKNGPTRAREQLIKTLERVGANPADYLPAEELPEPT